MAENTSRHFIEGGKEMTHEYEKMFNFVAHRSTYRNHKEMPFPSHQIGSKKSENTNSGRQCNNRNFPLPLLPCELALPPGKTSVKQNTGARYSPRFVLLEKPCRWHTQDTRTGVVTPLSWWAERSRGGGSPEPVYRIMNKWSPRVQWNSRAQWGPCSALHSAWRVKASRKNTIAMGAFM